MPWKIFEVHTPLLIQGMTGQHGQRLAAWLKASGANIVAGVTPGKGGQEVEGIPIFDGVQAARRVFPRVVCSTIVVPASRALGAAEEAMMSGIRYLTIFTEHVPVHDVRRMRQMAGEVGATILGPSSVGYLQFPAFRTGYIGGEDPWPSLVEGETAILSTSGGMANELMQAMARAQIGIRLVFAVGGDRLHAFSLEEAVEFCEFHPFVNRIVLFAEPGCPFLLRLLEGRIKLTKPLVLFLAGDILDYLPRGRAYGHTGTLLGEDEPSIHTLREALRGRGYVCVSTVEACLQACK